MNYKTIIVDKKGHIGLISLNRPDQLNTFNSTMASNLNDVLNEMEDSKDIRVIVIKGEGKAFSAGIDLNEIEGKGPLDLLQWAELMGKMYLTIANMRKPVIVSVQDLAIANGIGLVAAADLAVAAEGSRFGATAVNVGLFCMGPAVPLFHHMGKKKVLELVLSGEMIDAVEAEKFGLINKVVPKNKLEEETMKLAEKIAAKSPIAVQIGKRSFYEMINLSYERAIETVNNNFVLLCLTEDAREGVNAFLNKRTHQ